MKENKNEKDTGMVEIPEDLKKILNENRTGEGVAWKIIKKIKPEMCIQKNDKLVPMYGADILVRMFKEGMKYANSPEKQLMDLLMKMKQAENK